MCELLKELLQSGANSIHVRANKFLVYIKYFVKVIDCLHQLNVLGLMSASLRARRFVSPGRSALNC